MKKMVKHFRVLTLMIVLVVTTGVTTSSAPAPEKVPDPGCVTTCAELLYLCILNQDKNNCISVYRHCMAQCGKH